MPSDGPVFEQVNLVVSDVAKTVEFYRRLGVTIPDTMPEWQGHHRETHMPGDVDMEIDSAAFAATWDKGWPQGRRGVVLGFRVASRQAVDETYGELTGAGYTGEQAPYDAFWGARYAIVQDPDGNPVGIMSPVDRAQRRPSPPPPS